MSASVPESEDAPGAVGSDLNFWEYCWQFMEDGEPSQQAVVKNSLSIARGGPIFLQDLVSLPTRVPFFESEVFHELESLKTTVGSDSIGYEEDTSVDELKLYTDEDLVREAMKIAFQDNQEAEATASDMAEQPCSTGGEAGEMVLGSDKSASCESSEGLSSKTSHAAEKSDANLKKRGRSGKNKAKLKNKKTRTLTVPEYKKCLNESYLEKLEPLVKIRQKQEEDKASVRLHSFNHKKERSAAVSSANFETLKCLESSRWPPKVKCSQTTEHIPIQYPEVVLCVEVYHHKQPWKKMQEFLILGRQALTELRDKIRCFTDVVMETAYGKKSDHRETMSDPSGYFLIEEFFCNDMRHPSAIDYSEPILDWLKNSKEEALAKWEYILSGVGKARKVLLGDKAVSQLPTFRSVKMEGTRFCDLGFRLGTGYLYCHQGDCKHVIVFRDMRLIHPDDVQNRAAYPLTVYQLKPILKKCAVCHICKATKVTCDDKLAGMNPCYFCDNCYFMLHYSENCELLDKYSDFKVFDYLQEYY